MSLNYGGNDVYLFSESWYHINNMKFKWNMKNRVEHRSVRSLNFPLEWFPFIKVFTLLVDSITILYQFRNFKIKIGLNFFILYFINFFYTKYYLYNQHNCIFLINKEEEPSQPWSYCSWTTISAISSYHHWHSEIRARY